MHRNHLKRCYGLPREKEKEGRTVRHNLRQQDVIILEAAQTIRVYNIIIIIYIYIWDSFHENGPSFIIIKSYTIAIYLNRNNFRTVKAINFLL